MHSIEQALARLKDGKMVILVDDAQWSLEILAVFRQLFSVEGHRNLRIFFAVAVRDETDESTSALEQRQLNDLLSERRVTLLELDRLRAEDLEEMLHRRLGMLPALTEKAMQWCAGSPMMAHQLIESWHTEGVLVGSLQGIGHQNPDGIALPSNFARLWTQRLDQVLEPLDESLPSGTQPCQLRDAVVALGILVERRKQVVVGRPLRGLAIP